MIAEWQPIDTAPKDGSIIDLWHRDYGRIPENWWVVEDACWCGWDADDITHWMPLPEPPK